MPAPAFLFIPWLIALFTSLVTYLAAYLTKRIAIVAAAILAFTGILLTFKLAIEAAFSIIGSVIPTGVLAFGLGLLPDNTVNCMTAIATAHLASLIFSYWRNIIAFRLTAN
jgi:MFS superfamily sulfate permease-like transporter